MYNNSSGRAPKGSVGIETFRGRLRLRLPRQLFDGKQKYLYTELADTDVNRRAAEAKAKVIESDIAYERFDYTLTKYGRPQPPTLTVVETLKTQSMTALELWNRFAAYKAPRLLLSLMQWQRLRMTRE